MLYIYIYIIFYYSISISIIFSIDLMSQFHNILESINIMVSNSRTDADKQSGCIIVLYALAFINNRCVMANPWLS